MPINAKYLKAILKITKNTPFGVFFLVFPLLSESLEIKDTLRQGRVVCHTKPLLQEHESIMSDNQYMENLYNQLLFIKAMRKGELV